MDRYVVSITWLRAWKVYWSHAWRACLLGVAVGVVAGLLLGLLSPLIRVTSGGFVVVGMLALFIVIVLAVGAWSMKRALQVRYADFQIDVIPVDPASAPAIPTTATLTESHGLAVFWSMAWRAWLIYFPVNLMSTYLFKGTALPTGSIDFVLMALQLVVAAALSTWALRIALTLDYGNWRLQLVPAEPAPLASPTLSTGASPEPR